MSLSKYRIEVIKENNISNVKILEDYIHDTLFHIIWLNKPYISVGEVFTDLRELKRKYHGQSYFYFPIKINTDGNIEYTDEENKQGYVIISKREYRTKNACLKYDTNNVIVQRLNDEKTKFLKDVNLIIHGVSYKCKVYKDSETEPFIETKSIFTDDSEMLKRYLLNEINVEDEELFDLIKTIEIEK